MRLDYRLRRSNPVKLRSADVIHGKSPWADSTQLLVRLKYSEPKRCSVFPVFPMLADVFAALASPVPVSCESRREQGADAIDCRSV